MSDIQNTLDERGRRYGSFEHNSNVSRNLKDVLYTAMSMNPNHFSHVHREALSMICHQIARIVNGDPNYDDSWRDIAGFSMLVVQNLEQKIGRVVENSELLK